MTDLYAKKRLAAWPEHDPKPTVTSRDPRPEDCPAEPKSIKDLAALLNAGGWETRIGYSRAWKRQPTTGTYRPIETFAVWCGEHECGWRAVAVYERFSDGAQAFAYFPDVEDFEEITKPTGKAGTWKWSGVTVFKGFTRHQMDVTDLKEFARVRGSVLPGWFKGIAARKAEQKEKQKAAAKARPSRKSEGN
jgi:hypothetical protein